VTAHTRSRRGAGKQGRRGAHELRGSTGMLFPYLIWLEMGQKWVIDGKAIWVLTGGDGGTAFRRLGCRRMVGK
jgi:hypothetical protein